MEPSEKIIVVHTQKIVHDGIESSSVGRFRLPAKVIYVVNWENFKKYILFRLTVAHEIVHYFQLLRGDTLTDSNSMSKRGYASDPQGWKQI